jgi:hypothetical protein|nr:MAG TPA: hypothetical protein [Caudoviricetes sp.]
MSLHKTEKSLKELHRKLAEEQKLRELPGLVAEIEDAMCEQDTTSEKRMAAVEDSLCELDAAVNK